MDRRPTLAEPLAQRLPSTEKERDLAAGRPAMAEQAFAAPVDEIWAAIEERLEMLEREQIAADIDACKRLLRKLMH
jgi:hypothetical protein